MADFITPTEFDASDVGDWRLVGDGVCAFFATGTLATGALFVQAIAAVPGVEDHPPDIDVRPEGVTVRLLTMGEDGYGPSRRDVEMARKISAAARSLHLAADPSTVQSVLVIPGAPDTAAVMPFWEAMLGYARRPDSPDEDLVDPRRRGPSFWFERMEDKAGRHGRRARRGVGAVRTGRAADQGRARGRWPDSSRRVRADVVDAERRRGQ